LEALQKLKTNHKDWMRRRKDLEELIRRVYIHTTADLNVSPAIPSESPIHKRLLKRLRAGCTVITFNYDLVIEESLSKTALWNPRDGYGLKVSGISHEWTKRWYENSGGDSTTKSKISLLKLHGSLGWVQYANHQIRLKNRPYVVRKGIMDRISILPPGWNKPIDRNPYKGLWRQARLKLESCNSLLIIGYSLPDTDLLARALFSEVVRSRASRKKYLQNLFLIDISDQVKSRFATLFTPAMGPYGKVFRFKSFEDFGKHLGEESSG